MRTILFLVLTVAVCSAKFYDTTQEAIFNTIRRSELNLDVAPAAEDPKKADALKQIQDRRPKVEGLMTVPAKYTRELVKETVDGSARDIFNAIFGEKEFQKDGQTYPNFFLYTKAKLGATQMVGESYNPALPKAITEKDDSADGLASLGSFPERTVRNLKFVYPVRGGGGFLNPIPATCNVVDTQYVYFLNTNEISVETEGRSSGIPKGDSFFIRNSYSFKEIDDGKKCEFTWKFGVEFTENTIFSGKITSTANDEINDAVKAVVPMIHEQMKAYLGH